MNKIRYRSGYKYQLTEAYTVKIDIEPGSLIEHPYIALTKDGYLTLQYGYAWDGPSGPTVDTKSFMRGSLVHDALYQLIGEGLLPLTYRKAADEELRKICLEDGMWSVRAWWVYQGVRFGGGAAAASPEPEALEAP